jgi:hypothetical protein
MLYHGSQKEMQDLLSVVSSPSSVPEGVASGMYPVVVTSYEVAMKDHKALQSHN